MSFFRKRNACGHLFSRKHGLGTQKRAFSQKILFSKRKSAGGHLFSRKHGLGLPIHMQMLSIFMNIALSGISIN